MARISDLIRELSFLQAGGRPAGVKDDFESIGQLLSIIGNVPLKFQEGRKIAQEREKDILEQEKLAEEIAAKQEERIPLARAVGAPEPAAAREALAVTQRARNIPEFTKEDEDLLARSQEMLKQVEQEPVGGREDRRFVRQQLLDRINKLKGRKAILSMQGPSESEEF